MKKHKRPVLLCGRVYKSLLFYAIRIIFIYKITLNYIILYVLIALHFAIHSDIIILIMFKGSLKNAVAAAVGAY